MFESLFEFMIFYIKIIYNLSRHQFSLQKEQKIGQKIVDFTHNQALKFVSIAGGVWRPKKAGGVPQA